MTGAIYDCIADSISSNPLKWDEDEENSRHSANFGIK